MRFWSVSFMAVKKEKIITSFFYNTLAYWYFLPVHPGMLLKKKAP